LVGDYQSSARATLGGFELSRPAEPETVPVFRHYATAFAAEHGAGDALIVDVALAVTEATTNAVKYAYPPERPGNVELSASVEDGWLTLRVCDRGEGFREGAAGGLGLGLAIIARVSDRLQIVQERSGTEVLMRFVLESERGGLHGEPEDQGTAEPGRAGR
jgi:anti-sigma regulatory factor (Ser/Thr protein kinase)